MKELINPKCPYCKSEYKAKSMFNNQLSGLYGEYCSSTVSIQCEKMWRNILCEQTNAVFEQENQIKKWRQKK